jgi:dTMP kinase
MSGDTPARFITLEGGEGAGKSTQARRLADTLCARGIDSIVTREPGGSPGAEDIRKLLVEGEPGRWDGAVEAMLMFAARADHLAHTIRPALVRGQWVICDRFSDSTYAYQGVGRGVPLQRLREIQNVAIGDFSPDLTLILDLPVEAGMKRIGARTHAENRFEKFDQEFHERLRQFFRELAAREPERCVLIDASAPPERVSDAIWRAVADRLGIG